MKKLMLVLVLVVALGSIAFAQSGPGLNTGTYTITVTVAATTLVVGDGDLTVSGIPPGTTFAVVPDGAGAAYPPDGGGVTTMPDVAITDVEIAGDPGADVAVSFALPYFINSVDGQSNVRLNYNSTSAVWVAAIGLVYFDPTHTTVVTLDDAGAAVLELGAIISVGANATQTEDYVTSAVISAAYTGL